MSRIAYVNGRYVPHRDAQIHIEDRGYQFSDGVYEVIAINGGRIIDGAAHLDRLERSLRELRIAMPMARSAIDCVSRETLRRNRISNGILYQQVSRGVAARDHAFPKAVGGALVMTARPIPWPANAEDDRGINAITRPDIRWLRRDIKSISLLPNILAKQDAKEAGANETWFVDDAGMITEGSSTNTWIVDHQGRLITRGCNHEILGGITRARVIELARENGIEVVERPFSRDEALQAAEAFITSTTSFVRAVVHLDDADIGTGAPGPVTQRLRALYLEYCRGRGANT